MLTVLLLVHPLVLIGLLRDIVVVPVLASYFPAYLRRAWCLYAVAAVC